MINVYDLTNATVVALFGMFALWAAGSKRHWFVRTSMVAGAILITLLVPAYELVFLLSVETLVVVSGIAIWRRRRQHFEAPVNATPTVEAPRRVRLSMQTLMLAVVIVAVVTAVAARAPIIPAESWYSFAVDGFVSGLVALFCVWLVCGRTRWWIRACVCLPMMFVFAFGLVSLHWAGYIVKFWLQRVTGAATGGWSVIEYLKLALRDIPPAALSWSKPVALGTLVACVWLYCVRRAGWFDPLEDHSRSLPGAPRSRGFTVGAYAFAMILFCVVSIFPLVLLYELRNPTPIPSAPLPDPNGFDDLIAAGNMIGPTDGRTLQNCDRLTVDQLGVELAKHQRAFDRMREGLQRPSRNPYVFKPWPQEDSRSLTHLFEGMRAWGVMARRTKNLGQELENNLTLLRIAQEEGRGAGAKVFDGNFKRYETDGYTGIWSCAPRLSAARCEELLATLRELEDRREPWEEQLAVERAIEDNSGWEQHLTRLLHEWSGEEFCKWERIEEWRRIVHLRMLMVKLAIRSFQRENNDQLPESLDQLVPEYLRAVPMDPFGDTELRYRAEGNKYVLYSCGPDGDDDGGQPRTVVNQEELGDMLDSALFGRAPFQPSIGPP